MWLAPDNTWKISPLKFGSLDPGLRATIIDINIHPISFCTTPEILKNSIAEFSRGGIHKTETEAEILIFFQEVEFTNQDYRQIH